MRIKTNISLGQHPVPLTDLPYLDATLPTHTNDLAGPIDAQNFLGGTAPCFDARDRALEVPQIPETDDPIVGACQDLRCALRRRRERGSVGVCILGEWVNVGVSAALG